MPAHAKNLDEIEVAVLIPCYNEATTIAKVVSDFKKELPKAKIYVFDNNSTDGSYDIAKNAGAIVRREYTQGKGAVIRAMFSKIEADIYIIADGDDQCPAESAIDLIAPILDGKADISIGDRISNGTYAKENKRRGHEFGNHLVRFLVNFIFNGDLKDIMTGYRAFNRKFVKNFPIMKDGFEIETEITLHALHNRFKIAQIPIAVRDRPQGSVSSLNTYRDGIKILKIIFDLFRNYRPMMFFGSISFLFALAGLLLGLPVILEFIDQRYITHVPLAILAASIETIAIFLFMCALVMDSIVSLSKREYEWKLIQYETTQSRTNKLQ